MKLFDSHAHLSSDTLSKDIDGIMKRAKEANVSHILNICTDKETLKKGLELHEKYPNILNAGSTTPHDVEKEGEVCFPLFEEAARAKKLVAIGETGLDYFYEHSPKKLQQKFLVQYLQLARELNLPVIFHCREAFTDLFSIVDQEYPKNAPAILHCFTGTLKEAEEVLSRGWYLSLSGIVTFKKSEALKEVARMVPLSQLLIETDSPYLSPQSKRGKMNEPSYLLETAALIALEKEISIEEVAKNTHANTKKTLNL